MFLFDSSNTFHYVEDNKVFYKYEILFCFFLFFKNLGKCKSFCQGLLAILFLYSMYKSVKFSRCLKFYFVFLLINNTYMSGKVLKKKATGVAHFNPLQNGMLI